MAGDRSDGTGERPPRLTAARIVLRRPERRDAPDLFAVFSDRDVMRYWSRTPFEDESEAIALIDRIHALAEEGTLLQWAIAETARDRAIGTCTLAGIDLDNGRAEVGFILGREHHGKGLAREAVSTVLDHAFATIGLRRIEADVDPRNRPSIALLERLGFVREGHLRERWRVGGEIADSALYGLLAREWTSRRDRGPHEP